MKADLSADGTLTITPEYGSEAFALKNWASLYFEKNTTTKPVSLVIYSEVPQPPKLPEMTKETLDMLRDLMQILT